MYSIYCDGVCIHNDRYVADNVRVIDPRLKMGDNSAGSLKITVPPTNVGYDLIKRFSSEIIVYRDDEEIWSGRVVNEDKDFWNNRKLTCEGELAYLVDTTQPPAEYSGSSIRGFLKILLSKHNEKVEEKKRFYIGAVTVTDPNEGLYFTSRYTNYESTLECITNKLISNFGGHLRIRKENGIRYLDYLSDYSNMNTQEILFGENLLDFTRNWDLTELATVIVPRGAMLDESPIPALQAYVGVESVNDGSPYVTSDEALANFGWIEVVVHWDDVNDPEVLFKKAQKYLSESQFENMVLELSAMDLHYLSKSIEPIKLLDRIRCVSYVHGLDKVFPVTEIDIPLDSPENTEYVLGTEYREGLTGFTRDENLEIKDHIEQLPTKQSVLIEAKDNAAHIINSATNGFVTIVHDDNGTESLIISETKNYKDSQKLWRANINGFGYSKDGGKSYEVAITMDGAIVANFITTGTLSADRVRTGILQDIDGNVTFNLNTGTLTMKKGVINLGNGTFYVSDMGYVKATSGKIGGFNLGTTSIYNDSVTLDDDGISVKRNGMVTGYIGSSNILNAEDQAGLRFSLVNGTYMAWSYPDADGNSGSNIAMIYSRSGSWGTDKMTITAATSDFHGGLLTRAWIDPNTGGANGGVTGQLDFFGIYDGTDSTITGRKVNMTFKNGLLIDAGGF